MAIEDTSGEGLPRTGRAWLVVIALAAFVAGAGIIIDAEHWALLFVGELAAYAGVLIVTIWLIVRGTNRWIAYPLAGALILGWTFRGVPRGGVSGEELRAMAIVTSVIAAAAAIHLLWRRSKARRELDRPNA